MSRYDAVQLDAKLDQETGRRLALLAIATQTSMHDLIRRYVEEGLDRDEKGDESATA